MRSLRTAAGMYYDRAGEKIDSLKWGKLYRNPVYAIVKSTVIGKREVRTSWIGVAHKLEQFPTLFLVQLRTVVKRIISGHEVMSFRVADEQWYRNESLALEAHEALVNKENEKCTV